MACPLGHINLGKNICFRQQRIAEMKELQQKAKFGDVREISAIDYVDQVNKAGEGVWVILHLFKSGYLFNGSLERNWFSSHLTVNFTKWSNTLKQFVGTLPTNCLSVIDHFVGLVRKRLISMRALKQIQQRLQTDFR